ncbi:MAG: hypothetical protein Q4F17_08910 [Eubacteriales bacterium]|nr:hypothetical protein [Eubacteriales bacterium]
MKLLIRQRMFSWTDSYDVYDEAGVARYEVRAELLTLGHQIHIYQKGTGREVGSIHQHLLTLLPRFDIVIGGQVQGTVSRELTLFRPRYSVDYRGWEVAGDFLGWDYRVTSGGRPVMTISKEVLNWTDTYVLDVPDPENEMPGLLLVIAIDAANCGKI